MSRDVNQEVNSPKPSKKSTDDLDFFDSNTLIPPNQEGDLNTIEQHVVEEAQISSPLHEDTQPSPKLMVTIP